MRSKGVFFCILTIFSFQSHANFAAGVATGAASASNRSGSDIFISRKFDYIVACDLVYEKIKKDEYEYICPNPPTDNLVLFMSTVFDNDHWPARIIYYMKHK